MEFITAEELAAYDAYLTALEADNTNTVEEIEFWEDQDQNVFEAYDENCGCLDCVWVEKMYDAFDARI